MYMEAAVGDTGAIKTPGDSFTTDTVLQVTVTRRVRAA